MGTRAPILLLAAIAFVGCKAEGASTFAGTYALDRAGMKANVEAEVKSLPPAERAAALEVFLPAIEEVDMTLLLKPNGDGVLTIKKLSLEGEETVLSTQDMELEWSVREDGVLILDNGDGTPSSCGLEGPNLTCVTQAQETKQRLVFIRS